MDCCNLAAARLLALLYLYNSFKNYTQYHIGVAGFVFPSEQFQVICIINISIKGYKILLK